MTSAKGTGLVKRLGLAVAYHFCLALPEAFTQPGTHLLASTQSMSSLHCGQITFLVDEEFWVLLPTLVKVGRLLVEPPLSFMAASRASFSSFNFQTEKESRRIPACSPLLSQMSPRNAVSNSVFFGAELVSVSPFDSLYLPNYLFSLLGKMGGMQRGWKCKFPLGVPARKQNNRAATHPCINSTLQFS